MTTKIIQQRKPIFIACEGESEQSFVKWLQYLSDQQKLHIYLDCQPLGGGGYKTMLNEAIRQRKRKERNKIKTAILLVDADRADLGHDGWTLSKLQKEALNEKIRVCIQNPN